MAPQRPPRYARNEPPLSCRPNSYSQQYVAHPKLFKLLCDRLAGIHKRVIELRDARTDFRSPTRRAGMPALRPPAAQEGPRPEAAGHVRINDTPSPPAAGNRAPGGRSVVARMHAVRHSIYRHFPTRQRREFRPQRQKTALRDAERHRGNRLMICGSRVQGTPALPWARHRGS